MTLFVSVVFAVVLLWFLAHCDDQNLACLIYAVVIFLITSHLLGVW